MSTSINNDPTPQRPSVMDIYTSLWRPNLGEDLATFGHEEQKILTNVFNLWRAKILVLLCNLFGAFLWMIIAHAYVNFVISIILLIVVPLIYYTWFQTLKTAMRTNNSNTYLLFFLVFGIHCLFAVLWAFGVVWGTVGLTNAIESFACCPFFSFIFYGLTAVFTVYAILAILTLIQVHNHYRATGANIPRASNQNTPSVPVTVVIGSNKY